MSLNFKLYSQYYDLLYEDKDYPSEVNYIADLINSYSTGSKTLLELGAGTGKHAFLLAEKGFQVTGIERSADMVAIAKNNVHSNVNIQIGDITDFNLNQTFEVATSLFHVISYLTENKDLINTFKNINKHLQLNGVFIFDVWHSSAVYHQLPEKRIKILKNDSVKITRNASPIIYTERNVIDVNYHIRIQDLHTLETHEITETHPMRHFSKPEIEILACATGFELVHTEEFKTKAAPSPETWGVCYILKKFKSLDN